MTAERPSVEAMRGATPPEGPEREAAIERILESAQRMGIEIDRAEAELWIGAMISESVGGAIQVDVDTGVYGHRVSMADYSATDLARFREMGVIVGLADRPPVVTTALALSGSAAQGKIQRFPADCDFFERVHIRATSREEALAILGDVIRDKALDAYSGPGHRLWEVKWGTHDEAGTVRGEVVKAGGWISWKPEEVREGRQLLVRADGTTRVIEWAAAPGRPGWSKLDWLIGDKGRGVLANASNVLDPTWEAPDGSIVPLDGFLEPYFQEVYLDTDSIPLFSRLIKELGADAVDDYVDQLEHEVWKYSVVDPNYGKVARRLYNVFRLSGRYYEAAYIRELFDEPVTALYQLAALLRTVDDADIGRRRVRPGDRAGADRRAHHLGGQRAGGPRRGRDGRAARPAAGGHRGALRAGRAGVRHRRCARAGDGRRQRLLPARAAHRAHHRRLPRRDRHAATLGEWRPRSAPAPRRPPDAGGESDRGIRRGRSPPGSQLPARATMSRPAGRRLVDRCVPICIRCTNPTWPRLASPKSSPFVPLTHRSDSGTPNSDLRRARSAASA